MVDDNLKSRLLSTARNIGDRMDQMERAMNQHRVVRFTPERSAKIELDLDGNLTDFTIAAGVLDDQTNEEFGRSVVAAYNAALADLNTEKRAVYLTAIKESRSAES